MTDVPYAEVIGQPVSHSKSPAIHRFWLKKLSVEGDYRAICVTTEELPAYLESRLADPAWRGCSVTMPHKQYLYSLIGHGRTSDLQTKIYNCVAPRGGELVGANTDIEGFIEPLSAAPVQPGLALVIGAGGAARTAVCALAARGFAIEVRARSAHKAAAMLEDIGISGKSGAIDDPFPPAALLVNASPLGMAGFSDFSWDLGPLPRDAIVYDMVYEPVITRLIAAAYARGLYTIGGLHMLVGQAAGAFQIFFGYKAPREYDAQLHRLLDSGP